MAYGHMNTSLKRPPQDQKGNFKDMLLWTVSKLCVPVLYKSMFIISCSIFRYRSNYASEPPRLSSYPLSASRVTTVPV